MDPKVTQIPGKSLSSKLKFSRKVSKAPVVIVNEPPISRQKRAFGTVRSTNIPIKTVREKPAANNKPSIGALQKQPKSVQLTQNALNASSKPVLAATDQICTEKPNPRLKKKSPGIKQQVKETILNGLHMDSVVEPQTPVAFPRLLKGKNAGTPYHTAEKCSKCRFDKMETSSYWLSQIKLAESVGKHFVSAAFFRLAYECNAEPIRTLKVELKHYLTRHEHLSAHTEWKDVCQSYGLFKDGGNCVEFIMPETSSCELAKDQTETIVSEANSSEPIKDKGMPEISNIELNKIEIVSSGVGQPETGTTQICHSSLSLETDPSKLKAKNELPG